MTAFYIIYVMIVAVDPFDAKAEHMGLRIQLVVDIETAGKVEAFETRVAIFSKKIMS